MTISKATLLSVLTKTKAKQDAQNEATYVKKETGKGLSTNDYTATDKTKLDGVETGAQANVIESVSVDGTALTVTSKGVNIDLSAYAKSADISTVYKYKGTVATYSALPTADQVVGDVYNVEAADATNGINAGDNVAWNGTAWDNLSGIVDLSGYVAKEDGKGLSTNDFTDDLKNKLDTLSATVDETVSDEEIAALFTTSGSSEG